MKETTTSKIINASLVVFGLYIAYKSKDKPGFWSGVGASILVFGVISLKIYQSKSNG